jgi:acyl carrier protein
MLWHYARDVWPITTAIFPNIERYTEPLKTKLVKPDVALREQLDLDSMDFLDIVMELRKKYHIEVPEADYKRLESLDFCAEYLADKFKTSEPGVLGKES